MINVTKYDTIKIDEYKGQYSVALGWMGREGEWKQTWCTREFGKETKKVPVRVPLGASREEAMQTLQRLMSELQTHDGGDDVPF